MKVEVRQQELVVFNEATRVKIQVDGVEYRLSYSKVYGLIVNKVAIDDDKEDFILVQPRTGNEIILK